MSTIGPAVQKPSTPVTDTAATRPPANTYQTITSHELFKGSRELLIEHDGSHYRLRQTSKGKLILTK
jgi:hemin uptake protein HemP